MIATREVRVCESTGNRVVMEHTGLAEGGANGHPGWFCLHEDEETGGSDEEAVKQFLLDELNR